MTERLYYTDADLREFDASILHIDVRDGRTAVVLDRSAFYPASGGQPSDVGFLADHLRVSDVIDAGEHIEHIVDARPDALSPGQTVHGSIDWTRRFDHMQQHTGQHVLSAAFDRLFAARTVSFHLGAESSTVDLSRELTRDQLVSAEIEANRIVWEDRSVTVRFTSAEDAARMPLRKESDRGGTLRLIDIENFDLSACGGTHVQRTGSIGIVAIGSTQRFKGGQRVEFFCGSRALTQFRFMRDVVAAAVRRMSVVPSELPDAIEKLQAESREHQRVSSVLQHELAHYKAEELSASAEPLAHGRLVTRVVDADANGLKALASAIVARPGHIAVLLSATTPAVVVVARSLDVAISANQLIATLTTKFGGRGGGKVDLAQAGGLQGDAADILEASRTAIL